MNYFYSDIIEIESLIIQLDSLDLEPDHKKHLAALVDSTIHISVMDFILDKLPDQDKEIFLKAVAREPNNKKHLDFLDSKVNGLSKDITKMVEKIKVELCKDIEESHRLYGRKKA